MKMYETPQELNAMLDEVAGTKVLLVDACNSVLSGMTADDFTALMKTAISIQPLNG